MVRNEYLVDIVDMDSKGGVNIAVDTRGKVVMWPLAKERNKLVCRPMEVPLEHAVGQVACGNDFTILLTKGG